MCGVNTLILSFSNGWMENFLSYIVCDSLMSRVLQFKLVGITVFSSCFLFSSHTYESFFLHPTRDPRRWSAALCCVLPLISRKTTTMRYSFLKSEKFNLLLVSRIFFLFRKRIYLCKKIKIKAKLRLITREFSFLSFVCG